MNTAEYLAGIDAIYRENPSYKLGHDGSDGFCDCIGMCKGAIKRGGESPSGLSGTNYAARNTIKNLKQVAGVSSLQIGEVVLKSRNPGESGYNLPERYRIGGKDYNGDLRDYYHIGTVTGLNPLEITHMTTPHPKKDTKIGKWSWHGNLPQVKGGEPLPETFATVTAPTGSTVNMRKQPSMSAALVERVPVGSTVQVLSQGEWDEVRWKGKAGYMLSRFLVIDEEPPILETYTVTIPGLSKAEATALVEQYHGAEMSIG